MIFGLVAARFSSQKTGGIITTAILFLLIMLSSSIFLIADNLSGQGFDESVFYHLQTGIGGAGIEDFYKTIVLFLTLLGASIFLSYITYRYLKSSHTREKNSKGFKPIPVTLLVGALLAHPLSQDMMTAFSKPSDLAAGHGNFSAVYQDFLPSEIPTTPPNIVYIYLESLERTYMDENIFPGLTKELHILEDSALSFVDIEQTWSTGWTIAGMTASQCTIPLVTTGSGINTMYGMEEFYPKATCLGDILKNRGFNLSYMGGAHLAFAGKGKFYSSHGFENVRGREELKKALKNKRYRNSWGLYDDTLFDLAWEEFLTLSGNDKEPFGLFLLTLDTHQPDGYPSASCKDIVYHKKDNSMLNAVACSNYLVAKFVNKIMASRYAENTLIVLTSDHLALPNRASKMLQQGQRRNLFMALQKNKIIPKKIPKAGTMLDIAPTLLDLLGYKKTDFGLGRNLLGNTPTLREQNGNLDNLISGFKPALKKLWQFPSLEEGIFIDPKSKTITLGEETMKLPILLKLEDPSIDSPPQHIEIKSIHFKDYWDSGLKNDLSSFLESDFFIWIDQCKITNLLVPGSHQAEYKNYCLFAGKLGRNVYFYTQLVEKTEYAISDIAQVANTNYSPSLYIKQKQNIKTWKDKNPSVALGTGDFSRDYYVISQGGVKGKSQLLEGDSASYQIERGFNVFGITDNNDISFLYNADLCTDPSAFSNSPTLSETIDLNQAHFKNYIVSVHDSAYCQQSEYPPQFAKMGRSKWRKIAFREPYIAILDKNKQFIAEYGGKRNSSIRLHLKAHSHRQKADINGRSGSSLSR